MNKIKACGKCKAICITGRAIYPSIVCQSCINNINTEFKRELIPNENGL